MFKSATRRAPSSKRLALAIGALFALALGAAGCGTAGAGEVAVSSCGKPTLDPATHALTAHDGCKVNVAVAIDSTAFGKGPTQGNRVARAVAGAVSHTATNGGNLSVAAFGKAAARQLNLLSTRVTGASEVSEVERIRQAKTMEETISAAARALFVPAERSAALNTEVLRLGGDGGGTDVGRATRRAIEAATVSSGPSAAFVFTDGVNYTPDFDLAAELRSGASGRRLAPKLGELIKPGGRRVDLLVISGVGAVPANRRNSWTPTLLDELESVWSIACRQAANRCVVNTRL